MKQYTSYYFQETLLVTLTFSHLVNRLLLPVDSSSGYLRTIGTNGKFPSGELARLRLIFMGIC